MSKPRVSIIIPTYCPTPMVEEHLKRCLTLVRKFTPSSLYQLIIIEQGPRVFGGSAWLPQAPESSREEYVHFANPIGFAKAVNAGLALAQGEYVCILSNDVFVGHGWLEDLISEFESVPNMGMLAPMDDDHKPGCQCPWCLYKGSDTIFSGWHWGACMLLRTNPAALSTLLHEFSLNWRYCDQDMSIRLHQSGLMVARTSKVVVHHVGEATWKYVSGSPIAPFSEVEEKVEMIRRYGVSSYREFTGGTVTPVAPARKAAPTPLFSICHTTARPEKWREIYDAWIKAAVHPEQVEYVLCVDERWGFPVPEFYAEDFVAWASERDGFTVSPHGDKRFRNILVWNKDRRCYVDGVNTAAKASTGRILIVNADDQWPCEGWDEKIWDEVKGHFFPIERRSGLEVLRNTPGGLLTEKEFVVEVSTGTPDEHNRGIMVMPILSRARYERLGYVFYPEYESMFADNDFCEHARMDGVVIDARHLMFPHKHPLFDASARKQGVPWNETDEAYKVQNSSEAYNNGRSIMGCRRAGWFGELTKQETQPVPPTQRTIALCLTGENFRGEWFDGFMNLYDHLVQLNFGIYRLREYNSNVYVTREQVRQIVMSADPKPELILWLDDDNVCRPEQFDRLLKGLDEHPEADGLTGWAWIYDDEMQRFMVSCGLWAADRLHWQPFDAQRFPGKTKLVPVECSGFPCFLMKYSALEKSGHRPFLPVLDDRLTHGILGEDFAFCLNAEKGGAKFLVDPQVRVAHLKYRDTIPNFPKVEEKPLKIAAMLRVKNEARWIERVIKSLVPLCGKDIFVMDDGSTDDTRTIATDAGACVFRSPFTGQELDECRDKNWLMDRVMDACDPDWIFAIDGDEELEPNGAEKIRGALQGTSFDCFSVRFLYLWDKPDQARLDRWYSTFVRLSLFRPHSEFRFHSLYEGKGVHAGLHTGNAPFGQGDLHPTIGNMNVYLLHYGYMFKEDRIRKYEYYNRIDPNNEMEDGYRHIVSGDVPEVPASMKLKWAGPLDIRRLPESFLNRPLLDVTPLVAPLVESAAAD